MKISGRMNKVYIPLPAKREATLLLALFLFNCLTFSAWKQLTTEPWLWVYGLVMLIPLAWRNRAPLTIFVTQWMLTVAAFPIFPRYTPVVGIPVALYAVSTHYSRKISLPALLVSFIPYGLAAAVPFRVYSNFSTSTQISLFSQNAAFLVFMAVGAWIAGHFTRASHQHVRYLEHKTKVAQEATQEAVAKERRRIARELHDIVANAVAVIVLQAAGAARVAKTDFAEVIQSLANIETKGKQAMAELQRLLGVLDGSNLTEQATDIDRLEPQLGLADLTELLASFRATGMRVTHHVEGTPRELDPSVDLAAYRIVHEGLTNVLKHAGEHTNPQLRLVWRAGSLLIQIDNGTNLEEAHCGQAIAGGRGLVGLRERVHAIGGRLDAGPHLGGGYRLTATLPLATPATHPRVPPTTVPRPSSESRVR